MPKAGTKRKAKITHYPLTPCPWCLKGINAAAPAEGGDDAPGEGDVTICFECGEWCLFTAEMTLRKPTDDELTEIALDPNYQTVGQAWVDAQDDNAGVEKLRRDVKAVLRVVTAISDDEAEHMTMLAMALVTVCKTNGVSEKTAVINIKDMFSLDRVR